MSKYYKCINCETYGRGVLIYGLKNTYPVCIDCLKKYYKCDEKTQYLRYRLQYEVDQRLGLIVG